jgi:hypothetical protein
MAKRPRTTSITSNQTPVEQTDLTDTPSSDQNEGTDTDESSDQTTDESNSQEEPTTVEETPSPVTTEETPTPTDVTFTPISDPVVDAPVDYSDFSVLEDRPTDNENLTALRQIMRDFVKANTKPGKTPEHFKESASLAAALTRMVVQRPHIDVLDTLLEFFEENPKGVCDPTEFMKGSSTLSSKDEQTVGALFGLFNDLAKKASVKVNNGFLLQLLKGSILNYYNRKDAINLAASQSE